MAITYKVLGQINPAPNTLTTVNTVPSSTQTIVSTLSVCNSGAASNYRVAVTQSGQTTNVAHYIVFDTGLNGLDTAFLTIGLTLNSNDSIRVYANTANIIFNVFGAEIVA